MNQATEKYARLRRAGLSVKQVCELVGCSRDVLERLQRGLYIRRSFEEKLMAISVPRMSAKRRDTTLKTKESA